MGFHDPGESSFGFPLPFPLPLPFSLSFPLQITLPGYALNVVEALPALVPPFGGACGAGGE
jgi:hypothetical protein